MAAVDVDSKDDMSEQLEITISCKNLVSKDLLSKSDPFVVFSQKDAEGKWDKVGESETLKNDNHPKFAKIFQMKYYFEEVQHIQVEVYDRDSDSEQLSKHDFVGRANFLIGELVNSAGQTLTTKLLDHRGQPIMNKKKKDFVGRAELVLGQVVSAAGQAVTSKLLNGRGQPIQHDKKYSSVTVSCEEMKKESWDCSLNFAGKDFPRMDRLGSADPYFKLLRKAPAGGSWQEVHKSEVIKNNKKNPDWKPLSLTSHRLCGSDFKREMRIEVWDWDKHTPDDMIGEVEFEADELFGEKFEKPLTLEGKSGRGKVYLKSATRSKKHTFLEYLKGGTQISLMVAIDYTGSNGKVTDPNSLHYYNPSNPYQNPNEYMQAITAVGNVLAPYDTDNRFPVWAFGAVDKQLRKSMGKDAPGLFCEPINKLGFPQAPDEVQGVAGVLEAYTRSFQHLDLWYPTNFAPFLEKARDTARSPWPKDEQVYHVLLILTDGAISDMQKTKERLIDCSSLPLSVVIVGVGDLDKNPSVVSSMNELDGDDGLIRASGRVAERDFVQFVEFRKKCSNVAKATLAELPGQFLEYMKKKHIEPLDPEIRMARHREMLAQCGQSQFFQASAPMFQPMMQPIQGQPMVQPQYGAPGGPMMSPGYGAPNMAPQGMGMQGMQQAFGKMNVQPNSFGGTQPAPINANPSASAPLSEGSTPPPSYSP